MKKKSSSLLKKQQRAGYVFTAPIILGMLVVFIPVIIQTFAFSVNRPQPSVDGYTTTYIGLSEYKQLMVNTWFTQNLVSSIVSVLTEFISVLIFSFFIAVLLNQNFKGRTLARVIFFLPVVVSAGIISKLEVGDLLTSSMQQMNGADTGVINSMASMDLVGMIQNLSLNSSLTDFAINTISNIYNIIVSSGVQILIFVAGLQSISPHLYEAAHVEGCSGWESFWKITLPMVSPLILVCGIYTVIDSCTKPGNVIMTQVLNQTSMGYYSTASSMALVYFAIVAVIMTAIFLIARKLVFYQE